MTRTVLTDGRYFDKDKAASFNEGTRSNGSNMVSLATGSQWSHERLFRTKGGKWVLHHWSQWQGTAETYSEITDDQAARWLVKNEHEPHSACRDEYAALEVT